MLNGELNIIVLDLLFLFSTMNGIPLVYWIGIENIERQNVKYDILDISQMWLLLTMFKLKIKCPILFQTIKELHSKAFKVLKLFCMGSCENFNR